MFQLLKKIFGGESKDTSTTPASTLETAADSPAADETSTGTPDPGAGKAPEAMAALEETKKEDDGIVDDPDSPLREEVITNLKKVYDPEIPIDIYELGLIYALRINGEGQVSIDLTLTSPNCPAAEQIPADVETRARETEGVTDVKVHLVWEPPWGKDRMSEAALLELGME